MRTGSDEEEPGDDVDADLPIATSFEEIYANGGQTIVRLEEQDSAQDHRNNDEVDTEQSDDVRDEGRVLVTLR